VQLADEIVKPLMGKTWFKAWMDDGLEVRLENPEPGTKIEDLSAVGEEPALALIAQESNPPTLRRWAKREKRASLSAAIEKRLQDLG
jgi:hypothetical protein